MKSINSSILILVVLLIISCNGNRVNPRVDRLPDNQSPQNQDYQKDYSKLGIELMEKESIGGIKLGLNIKNLESMIGNPSEKTEPAIWGADGLNHQIMKYTTEGIELDLIQNSDSSFSINMITVTSPCKYKTMKGIGIDSDIEDVTKAYLEYIDSKYVNDKEVVAGSIYGGIIFTFEYKKVKSIFIGSGAE